MAATMPEIASSPLRSSTAPDLSAPAAVLATAGADNSLGAELVEVLREHRAPGRPLVRPFLTPGIDAVGHTLAAQRLRGGPRLTDVLPGALAGGEDDEPLSYGVELRPVEAGQEGEW